jgi:hypothetical protein
MSTPINVVPDSRNVYHATIRHHSISRARTIEIKGSLHKAKIAASLEFGEEFLDHEIVIAQVWGGRHEVVARRLVAEKKWSS